MEWALSVLDKLTPRGGTVIDVCPGVGGLTMAIARHVGEDGTVLAVEPRNHPRSLLEMSVRRNSMRNVVVLDCIGNSPDIVTCPQPSDTCLGDLSGVLTHAESSSTDRPCHTADRIVESRAKTAAVHLIKVSSCSYPSPWQVLEGAENILRRHHPVLYIESVRGPRALALQRQLRSRGLQYSCFWSAGRMFQRDNWRGVTSNVFGELSVFHQLCTPPHIDLHGLRKVEQDPWHKANQLPLDELFVSDFLVPNARFLSGTHAWLSPDPMTLQPIFPFLTVLHRSPDIFQIEGFLSEAECASLRRLAATRLSPSALGIKADGSADRVDDARRSESAFLRRSEDATVHAVEERAATLFDSPVSHMEAMQIVRYPAGGRFDLHQDSLPLAGSSPEHRHQVEAQGGQRIATLLLYLSDVGGGGETSFPSLPLSVAPSPGRALLFLPCDLAAVPDPRTFHEALPVTKGEKWLATIWLRQGPTQFTSSQRR